MSQRRLDVVFVDFYGTLVTGDRIAVEATCQSAVDDLRLDMSAKQLAIDWGKRFFAMIEEANNSRFQTLFDCECVSLCETLAPYVASVDPVPYASMLREYWRNPTPAPDVHEALESLDIPVCVVSNADTEDIHHAIDTLGLRVDHVITSEDTRSYKPDSAIFEAALRHYQVDPHQVIHAGDSLHSDVGGAQRLGIKSCWVCYEDRILDVGMADPDYKVMNLKMLREIV